ncbi:DUF6785 family protein [Desulfoferrobacter suflitae]|uniref:DUF6785 family protein n=1 Tax=Desulfoferrobacter suflitae TaxID=2865782 RepID=UPI00216490CD|nr:DUF6785 family protein [Desulfoferrobacter suflitae]MCK8602967.1 hypothetical protein [Desulfoferrobacter suflitae]
MREPKIRLAAVVLGLVLVVLACSLTPYNNVKLQNSPLAGGHFPLISFACLLFVLIIVNPVLSLIRNSWRFHLFEVLLIWSMVTVATGIAYTGLLRTFVINLTSPAWFATSAGDLGKLLLPLLPSALFPKDPDIIQPLYYGLKGGLDMGWWEVITHIPWNIWILPMFWWGMLVLCVYAALLGMTGVFSHQWIENEKMNFPLLRVPQILCEESESNTLFEFLRHRYFLIGFCIPLFLHTFNGLHTYFPQVPEMPTLILTQGYVPKEGMLAGFYKMKIYLYPAFIGFAFLTSNQVSFSLWFFFILGGFLPGVLEFLGWRLPAAALGTTFGPVLSRVEEMQMVGAFGIFFLFILWLARYHLLLVLRSLFKRDYLLEYHGLMSPRSAFYLFAAGFVGIFAWMTFFGMDVLVTIVFLAVCFMLQLVASRLICQGGLPYFTLTAAPSDGFLAFMNTRMIAPLTLYLALVVQKVTFLDMRESLAPSLFHSSRLADGSTPHNRFLWGVVWAIGVGLVVSFVAMMALYYKFGISTLPDDWAIETSRRVHENVGQLLEYPEQAKAWSITFTAVGAAVMTFLVLGYHHFLWWPLHPIGYLTTYSSAMDILWFSFFIGWVNNALTLRYGGVSLYKEVRRLFIGLVVGDMVMAVVWLIVGMFTPISYHVLPL